MSNLSLDFVDVDRQLPPELLPVTEDAALAIGRMADPQKRKVMADKLDQTLRGAWTVISVKDHEHPIGLVAVKAAGDDAQLVFGHVMRPYERESKEILIALVRLLTDRGFRVIRSIFVWPEPERFIEAAPAAGFARLDRMDMIRENDGSPAGHKAPKDTAIASWSPEYFEDVARIIFENYFTEDLIANPVANKPEGCRTHLHNIITDSYGAFTPGRSFVAVHDGRPVGCLLTSALLPGNALVVELAVDREFRGRGIASAMIGSLIGVMAEKSHIRLTVTVSNNAAVRLYERLGFQVSARIAYYVLVRES